MNRFIGIGRLTRDPELTTTSSGISVARFSLAITRRFANADGEKEADFFNCVAWRGLADTVHKYLKKGNQVGVEGNLQNRSWEAEDGTKRYATEVIVENITFVGSSDNKQESKPKKEEAELQEIDDDTLPF